MAKITITGLRRLQSHSKDDTDRDQGERTVPADTEDAVYEGDVRPSWLDLTPAQLTTRLSHLGYVRPTSLEADMSPATVRVVSADSDSCYDAGADEGLCIREDETFASWWTKLNGGHKQDKVTSTSKSVGIYGTTVTFERTLRVPDNGKSNRLPPGLGSFPLLPVADSAEKLPEAVSAPGGYMIPIYQREALWIRFKHSSDACNAMKVSVGGINALTGAHKNEVAKVGVQDYLCKSQQWLDGIVKEKGKVKQFVAMPVGQGYTIEEQLTGKNAEATLQLDVFPAFKRDVEVKANGQVMKELLTSPGEAGLKVGDSFMIRPRTPTGNYTVQTLTRVHGSLRFKAHYKEENSLASGIRASIERGYNLPPSAAARKLEATMGIAAGGSITQQIDKDPQDPNVYDYEAGKRIYIHFVNAGAWKDITGLQAPITPVDKKAYKDYSIPWFDLYNEPKPAENLGAGFSKIRSINDIDSEDQTAWVEQCGTDVRDAKPGDGDEDLFKARWDQENEGKIVDIDASKIPSVSSTSKLPFVTICKPILAATPVRSSTAVDWSFESDNVSRLTK